MTKKKAKGKKAAKKVVRRKPTPRGKKELHPAEVRKDISRMVEAQAKEMAAAVIGQGKMGQLAPVKYLLELASIFPQAADGEQVSAEEESFAETLLRRLNLPLEPIKLDEDDEPASKPAATLSEGNAEKENSGPEPGVVESKEAAVVGEEAKA